MIVKSAGLFKHQNPYGSNSSSTSSSLLSVRAPCTLPSPRVPLCMPQSSTFESNRTGSARNQKCTSEINVRINILLITCPTFGDRLATNHHAFHYKYTGRVVVCRLAGPMGPLVHPPVSDNNNFVVQQQCNVGF